MRTTVRLDDELLAAAKRRAAQRGVSLTSVIEDALREALARRTVPPSEVARLPAWDGGGARPGVHLDDSASLHEVMDGG